ncbi:MAG: alcohol dehydrogenase catalytic domain-containing protein [Actinomycetia bacterium]|nr:alcohol dehydrogenase catalytic domain-containing protein [Actinomycetes bacterium]
MILGHEAAGVVEAVGPGVTEFAVGDHVITCLSMFCGKCRYCLEGRTNLCSARPARGRGETPGITRDGEELLRLGTIGGFAEHMLMHENGLVRIRTDMPLDRAALISCGVMTGVGAALNRAKVAPGSSVAVFGTGGIGMSVVQGARIAGAAQIIAVDLNPGRRCLRQHLSRGHDRHAGRGCSGRDSHGGCRHAAAREGPHRQQYGIQPVQARHAQVHRALFPGAVAPRRDGHGRILPRRHQRGLRDSPPRRRSAIGDHAQPVSTGAGYRAPSNHSVKPAGA